MRFFVPLFSAVAFFSSCKGEPKEPEGEAFFPLLSFLQSQVRDVDTSVYSIIRIDHREGGRRDTTHIRREAFSALAEDFTSIPDISSPKHRSDFAETEIFDPELNSIVLTYLPKDEEAGLNRADVEIQQTPGQADAVKSIFIDRSFEKEDSILQKKLTWEPGNKRFKVITIATKGASPETIRTMEVVWAGFEGIR